MRVRLYAHGACEPADCGVGLNMSGLEENEGLIALTDVIFSWVDKSLPCHEGQTQVADSISKSHVREQAELI